MLNVTMKLVKKGPMSFAVLFLLSALVSQICGFNLIRSGRLGSLEDIEVNNFLDNNETISMESTTPETGFDTFETMCHIVENVPVDIDVSTKFPTLKFNATWITRKYFWLSDDFNFESRYRFYFDDVLRNRKLIKVFILPHSHNDPGWINTYEQYYYRQTKHILDNAVNKLTELHEMTFVWSEITYLAKWWKEAKPLTRQQFRKLVEEGRLEIATAGWVVPDEATSSLYSLLAELTEGQQWVKNRLNTTAQYSWAIDPFGHSATHSHLLKQASMKGMVIQRLHYAWKHWFAQHKTEEFRWRPRWAPDGNQDIPCLTLPFDLYSIKHACGPEPQVCLKFDFRSIQFEYGENYGLMTPVTRSNIRQSAQEIVSQYHKTASLTNHSVLLVPLGDDFRYDRPLEWEQQYSNYMHLFSYINSNRDRFRMDIRFGTLRDYFETVDELNRNSEEDKQRPSLSGDFFPYGDVYVSGRPAYWTGFYGTRSYWKKFHRELENELRSAEILFTYANLLAQKLNNIVDIKILSYKYKDLVTARQDFSVFTHHDGITGTSRMWTMDDYGDRLHEAYLKCISVQQQSLKIIYQKSPVRKTLPPILSKDFLRQKFEWLPSKVPLEIFGQEDEYATKIMIFNNLAWTRTELVKVLVKDHVVQVTDSKGAYVPSQVNPVFSHDEQTNTIILSERIYELVFLANLEPLATSIFKVKSISPKEENNQTASLALVTCEHCANLNNSQFPEEATLQEYMSLENQKSIAYFQENGLLENIRLKMENKSVPVALSFGLYKPTNRQSGAYLLKPILSQEWKFFQHFNFSKPQLIRLSGPVMSQLISIHRDRYETIIVNTTLINTENVPENSTGPQGILLETYVDFTRDYSNRAEVFMRLDTGLNSTTKIQHNETFRGNVTLNQGKQQNGDEQELVMYTDQNGFVNEKRLNVPSLEYEGNMYPVTTMVYIQDEQENMRFSVLVDRTHGFCSMNKGRLETLIERKSLYDDGRGMSEGVTDGRPTVSTYVLLLENLVGNKSESFSDWQPTLNAHKTSLRQNYPPNLFVFNEPNERSDDDQSAAEQEEQTISLISTPLPDNVHLLNLRTISVDADADDEASTMALLNLQYLLDFGNDSKKRRECYKSNPRDFEETGNIPSSVISNSTQSPVNHTLVFKMNYLNLTRVVSTSLTGVVDGDVINEQDNVNLGMYDATPVSNGTGLKQSTSLLVNFKLYFT